MRTFSLLLLSIIIFTEINAQIISGIIINEKNNEPIEYVNIGVVDMPIGTTTNKTGYFSLDIRNQPIENIIRISMIGFKAQSFTIEELLKNDNVIKLEEQPFLLPEIVVKPSGKTRKVGTTNHSMSGVCGWGGTQFGSGHEIGTKIYLGDMPVILKSLHVRLYKQSFDSTLLHLHVRDIVDNSPNKELLVENIYLTVSQESGWVEFDISKYDIVLSGEIALTLEWLNVFGVNENRLIRMNRSKEPTANVLFNVRKRGGLLYMRRGSEAKWSTVDTRSPSFYLTVIDVR
jgi:hypothetical protein